MSPPFPPPPKINRKLRPEDLTPPSLPEPIPDIPALKVKDSAKLTDDEAAFILQTTLRKDQYEDPKVIRYIMEYLVCRSTSQAAKASGFTYAQGYNLRQKAEIHACIQRLTEKSVLKYGYDASEVIERVKEIAVLDPLDFENPDGSYKTHLSQIRPEARRAVKSFTVKNLYGKDPNGMDIVIGQLIKVELWDKIKSIELLGREKNIFKETKKIEHDVTSNMAAVLLERKQRALAQPPHTIDVTPQLTGETHANTTEDTHGQGADEAGQADSKQ